MVSTTHAQRRANQRSISQAAVDFTLQWGTCYYRTGAQFYVLRRKDIQLSKSKDPDVWSWEGTTVLVEGDTILTVYQNKDVAHIKRKDKRDLNKSQDV